MKTWMEKTADFLRRFTGADGRRHFTSAVILAAGSGERFGNLYGRKQFVPLCSVPALVHTLRAFEESEYITEIVVVTREEDVRRCEEYRSEYGFEKVTKILAGGADRQASARRGLDAVSDEAEFIALHDGARCLVTGQIIADTVRAAYAHGAAVAAEPSTDSVKRVNGAGDVEESLSRDTIWLAKTPQVFLANMYRAAVYLAEKDGVRATDDSALVERLGFKVRMVDCGRENIKLTVPMDAVIAEAILRRRAEAAEAAAKEAPDAVPEAIARAAEKAAEKGKDAK